MTSYLFFESIFGNDLDKLFISFNEIFAILGNN